MASPPPINRPTLIKMAGIKKQNFKNVITPAIDPNRAIRVERRSKSPLSSKTLKAVKGRRSHIRHIETLAII